MRLLPGSNTHILQPGSSVIAGNEYFLFLPSLLIFLAACFYLLMNELKKQTKLNTMF